MDQFDIIGALETYAISKGWLFEYGFDNFYKNLAVNQEFDNGQLILIADFQANPTYKNSRVTAISYTCLLMLGRKFDADGQAASLDETSKQKYDRRLKVLAQTLAYGIADFACSNELEVTSAPIIVEINTFDANIDFATSNNAIFIQ